MGSAGLLAAVEYALEAGLAREGIVDAMCTGDPTFDGVEAREMCRSGPRREASGARDDGANGSGDAWKSGLMG